MEWHGESQWEHAKIILLHQTTILTERAHSWYTLSNLHTAGDNREEVGESRRGLLVSTPPTG